MFKIDIHTHIYPSTSPDFRKRFASGNYIGCEPLDACSARFVDRQGKVLRTIQSNCWDTGARLKEMDQQGVGVQVLSPIPMFFCYWAPAHEALEVARVNNDFIAEAVRKNPRRFVGLGTVPMQDPDLAIRELQRCVGELGLAGIEIGSHVGDWNLSAPELYPVFEEAARLGARVFIHPWDMMGQTRMERYWLPWLVGMPAESSLALCSLIFGGVLERLPQLQVAIAHGGGSFAATLGRIEHGFTSRPDLCAIDNPFPPSKYLGRFFVDALVHSPDALKLIVKTFGIESVALGTDYPFPLGEEHAGELIATMSDWSQSEREWMLHRSALKWLGRKREEFL